MNNKKITYPRFLDNKPCGKDLFEGKSHETIAQNIVNVIENNNSKIIGIDGGWGSGKSNMVNLIKDKLDKNKFHFFIYDAWGHQTDFQKRSILENLTGFLVDEAKILKKDNWNGRLLQLLSRKRSVGTKIVKELNAITKVSVLIAFTMPLLIIIDSLIVNSLGKLFYWGGVVLISLFLLCYLQIKSMKKYGQDINFSNFIHELFLSYMDYTNEKDKNSIEQSMKYETIYDEEPSSRDFKNWMKDINNDIKENKLIIVFDNMDRLPTDKVQELWASIHTFFAEEKYNNIHVIVPFDREHIKSAFKSEDIVLNQNEQSDPKKQSVQNDNNKSICFGNDFINKTFDVVYRVSPPVMSDWKTYFSDRWEEAFGEKVDNKITQIYDLLSKSTTPREIIAFINEFVSIKQLSDNSIPNEYIALFIFGKDKISLNPQKEILQPNYLGALDFMYKNDSNLPKFISALYYQLPPERALDIIYTENLKQALDNANIEQIESIQSQEKLFFSILENAIAKITNFSNAVISLDKCLKNENVQNKQMIWNCIYCGVKQLAIKEPLQQYQKILLTKIKDNDKEEYLKTIVLGLSNIQEFDAISFYSSIKQLSEIDGIDPYRFLSEKEIEADSFISYVELAKENFSKYLLTCRQDNLDKYFSELDVEQLSNLKAIPYIKDKFDITSFKTQLEKLYDLNLNNLTNIKIIYNRLKEIERPIRKSLADEKIYSHFSSTDSNDDFYYDLICMRIARLNKFNQHYRTYFNNVLNSTYGNLIENIAKKIEYYISFGDLLFNIDNMKNYPLYKEVVKKVTENSYGVSSIDIVQVLQNYEMIKNSLELDSEILIKRLNGWNKYAESKITVDNINSIPIVFFRDIMNDNNNISSHCKATAKDYLNSKTKEDWKQSILDNNYDYQLLSIIRPNIQVCFDAFKELLIGKVDGNNLQKNSIDFLVNLTETHGRKLLSAFNNVRDCFCDKGCNMTIDLFNCFGEYLLKYAKLEDKNSALRTIFPSLVLDIADNISLILKYQDKMLKIVEKAGEESKDFKDKIKSLLDNEYKDNQELENFAKSIGIQTQPETTNDEESV